MNELWLEPCAKSRWKDFAPYHYMKTGLADSCMGAFVAMTEDDDGPFEIGFAAAVPQPSGSIKNAVREHKIVVARVGNDRLPIWAGIADLLAQHYLGLGKRFYGHAPLEFTSYRDLRGSGWVPNASTSTARKRGYGAHEYVGIRPNLKSGAACFQ
jgi:hypothetical protein